MSKVLQSSPCVYVVQWDYINEELFWPYFLEGCMLSEFMPSLSEAYSDPCQTSKMERFAKIINN